MDILLFDTFIRLHSRSVKLPRMKRDTEIIVAAFINNSVAITFTFNLVNPAVNKIKYQQQIINNIMISASLRRSVTLQRDVTE